LLKAPLLKLVIPTEAKRSGGTCGSLHPQHPLLKTPLLKLVIPTEAKRRDLRFSPPPTPIAENAAPQTCHPDRAKRSGATV
jgi:hypothetical protein